MLDYRNLSDAQLLKLLNNSGHAAFTEIYNRYFQLLFVHAYKKLRDEELAKDIVQELFADLWAKREIMCDVKNLLAYLMVSVKHRIFDLFSHQKVQSKYISSIAEFLNKPATANTDYAVREKQFEEYINKQIAALPEKMRTIFLLNRKENLSYRQIAAKLDTSENNVQKHINGAIKILKAKLTAFSLIFF